MLLKSRSEEIKNDILKVINIMWYIAKVYIKSVFAFWGMLFLLAIKMHKNPFVEFQKFSGNDCFTVSVRCALVITIIFLAIKFASWLYDSGITVEIITIDKSSLGIAKEEDRAMARALCEALGAELGCSRPIAESEKWMEHERYIGISSVMPKPEIYISIGISGQIQHMVGVKDAGKIIVINKDKNAPIFDYADYGIVGDLYKVIPALVNTLK